MMGYDVQLEPEKKQVQREETHPAELLSLKTPDINSTPHFILTLSASRMA